MTKGLRLKPCPEVGCRGHMNRVMSAEVHQRIWIGPKATEVVGAVKKIVEIDEEIHEICDDCGFEV